MKIFTTSEIKYIFQETAKLENIRIDDLIDRGAAGIAAEINRRFNPTPEILIFAGPSENGACALSLARKLFKNGITPKIILFNIPRDPISEFCYRQKQHLISEGFPTDHLIEVVKEFRMPVINKNHLVIDGLFGSELNRPLERGYVMVVRNINESGAFVLSIDVPSGMKGDWNTNAVPRDIIQANLTITFQFPHLAFFLPDISELAGEWLTIDLGIPKKIWGVVAAQYYLVEKKDVKRTLHKRKPFSSKADYGNAIIFAGSYGMIGAAILAARGALRAGIGKLTVSSPICGFPIIQGAVPEALFQYVGDNNYINEINPRHKYDAVAVGPGIGTHEQTVTALEDFLARTSYPLILDADALNCIALKPTLIQSVPYLSILTPHAGEFDRLFGEHPNGETRLQKAIESARAHNVLIILKGHYSAVVRPDGKIYFNSSGTPALATPGSGDVLTGILTALKAQGYPPEIASLAGTYIHGLAGEMAAEAEGEYGVTASDIAAFTGKAIKEILNS